jgi:D-threo-aldose 1-dehydrogenase
MTTSSRRDFLGIAAAGSALAASGVFSGATSAASAEKSQGGDWGGRYVPPVKFGLGGVPLGNEFEFVGDEDAYQTLEAAWNAGVRYYDVAPWYGLGLAERRYGNFLHNKNRDEYVLSSKVGKLLKASPHNDAKSSFPFSPSPNNVIFDYTADGVRRSIEVSVGLTSHSCTTSRPTTNCCQPPGRSSSRSRLRAPFRPCRGCGRRGSSRAGAPA